MAAGKKKKGKLAVAGAGKKVVLKKKVPVKSKTAPQTGGAKVKPKPKTRDNKPAVEEAGGAAKSIEKIVTELVSDADEVTEKLAIAGGSVMEESVPSECSDADNQPQTGGSNLQPQPVTSETVDKNPAVPEVERDIFHKPVNTTSSQSAPDADAVPEKLAIMGGNLEESVPLECSDAENQPETGGSKLEQKPVTSETVDNPSTMDVGSVEMTTGAEIHEQGMPGDAENQPEAGQNTNGSVSGSCVSVKETVGVQKSSVFNLDAVKCVQTEDGEPMQFGETQVTQVQEVSSGTFLKRENKNSPPSDISADEASRKPAAPLLETPLPGSPVKASQHAEPNLPGAAQPTTGTPGIKTDALDVQQSDVRLKTKQEGRFDTWLMLLRDL